MRSPVELLFVPSVVDEVEPVTHRMRRISLTGEGLRDLAWIPGQHVRVVVTPPRHWLRHPGDARRTYSVWDLDRTRGRLDLCVLDHGTGPGADWARTVRPGQRVSLSRPEGKLTVRGSAGYHLFIGDETAAVAFAAMLRALPADAVVHGILETDSAAGQLPIPDRYRLPWVHRDGSGRSLLDALVHLDLPPEPGVAYLAGEARTCQALRTHLIRDRGWPRRDVITKPFWAPGKRGLE